MEYHYEGNIRELKNIVEYAVNVANTSMIEHENLPSYLFDFVKEKSFSSSYSMGSENDYKTSLMQPGNSDFKLDETWSSVQRKMILNALQQANGKKTEAAQILGMGRSTLWRKIKQYKIDP